MPTPGSPPSRLKPLARPQRTTLMLATLLIALPAASRAQPVPYEIDGDAIEASLTGSPGDPARGRALVINRQTTCVLCHAVPQTAAAFQGDLAPGLAGSGSRWSIGQMRLRLVDAARLNPTTIMPSYYRVDRLQRVAAAWRDRPILSAEQIEDMVAYLATLRD